jgi:hypothetical protein
MLDAKLKWSLIVCGSGNKEQFKGPIKLQEYLFPLPIQSLRGKLTQLQTVFYCIIASNSSYK